MASVEVDIPFYVGSVEALCLKDPLFDLIIGNVPGGRGSDSSNSEWEVVTAALLERKSGVATGIPNHLR